MYDRNRERLIWIKGMCFSNTERCLLWPEMCFTEWIFIHILISHPNGFFSGSFRKLTTGVVSFCQSFSSLCRVYINQRSLFPPSRLNWQLFFGLMVSSSPTRLHTIHSEILGHSRATNPALCSFPFSYSVSSITLRRSRGMLHGGSLSSLPVGLTKAGKGPMWCQLPFRVGRRCGGEQLKMIIPPLEAAEAQGSEFRLKVIPSSSMIKQQ